MNSSKRMCIKTGMIYLRAAMKSTILYKLLNQLEIEIPEELRTFYKNFGYGFLWFNLKQKKGIYRDHHDGLQKKF